MFHDRTFCVQSRHIHYPTEKNVVTVIKRFWNKLCLFFRAIKFLWEMKSIKFELAKILIQTMKINELKVYGKTMYRHDLEQVQKVHFPIILFWSLRIFKFMYRITPYSAFIINTSSFIFKITMKYISIIR